MGTKCLCQKKALNEEIGDLERIFLTRQCTWLVLVLWILVCELKVELFLVLCSKHVGHLSLSLLLCFYYCSFPQLLKPTHSLSWEDCVEETEIRSVKLVVSCYIKYIFLKDWEGTIRTKAQMCSRLILCMAQFPLVSNQNF